MTISHDKARVVVKDALCRQPGWRDQMLAYIDAMEAATTWRPIETKPVDGTRVLLLVRPADGTLCSYAMSGYMTYTGCVSDVGTSIPVTHWMPLPSTEVSGG